MLWLLEPDVFGPGPHPLADAAAAAGHEVVAWNDEWWSSRSFPPSEGPALFHGSLGNASKVADMKRWSPGAFCSTANLACSRWYPGARRWLLQDAVVFTTVRELAADPRAVAGRVADDLGRVFVRPDSPLKPFSGRVIPLQGLTPTVLDHGFYYDDVDLPVVVSRTQGLDEEWRLVVCNRTVIAGCQYQAQGRLPLEARLPPAVRALAETIAAELSPPDAVYGLDLVQTEQGLRLLELNPFSGMDLYTCDRDAIVAAVAA